MKLDVYLGTGGVGKTSVAAAAALKKARVGQKALVLTIDPALRLRSALQLDSGALEQRVDLDPPASGELWASLLDVRATLDEAVNLYAPAKNRQRILDHPVYAVIANSLVGMQELMAVERIDQLRRRGFEHIVVDTAPSRHAIEFLDKPMFFAELAGSRWVRLVGRSYRFVASTGMATLGKQTLETYARVENILGANLVRQILDFYSIFLSIAEGYATRAKKTLSMFRDPAVTSFHVVTTPQKALRDSTFFTGELANRQFPIGAFHVNRVWQHGLPPQGVNGLAAQLMDWYMATSESHAAAVAALRAAHPAAPVSTILELQQDVDGLPALEKIAAQLA